MNKRGNMIGVILIITILIILIILFLGFHENITIRFDETNRAITESILSAESSNLFGISNSMVHGFSSEKDTNIWYCNHPVPPNITQANNSLNSFTNSLLSKYFSILKSKGYSDNVSNFTHKITFPELDTTQVKIPGDAIIVTDLSGSMGWYIGGESKDKIAREMAKILIESAFNESESIRLGLIEYGSSASIVHELTNDKDALLYAVENMRAPGGGTCISCGIYQAVRMLIPPPPPDSLPNKPFSIVIMSDGVANHQFYEEGVNPDCLLLNSSAVDASEQTIDYARIAHESYNITFYSIGFYSDDDDPDGALTMEEIANVGGGNYSESDNPDELELIYSEFGKAVAKFQIQEFEYLKLDNNFMASSNPLMYFGLDNEFIVRTNSYAKNYTFSYSTWYIYKNILNWFLFLENDLNLLFKDSLTSKNGCQGVFYNSSFGGCPAGGLRHISNTTKESMKLTNRDMNPLIIKEEIETELNKFINNYNISCSLKYHTFNVSNTFIYSYGPEPSNLPINQIYGNGTFMIPGEDEIPRSNCSNQENFLGINSNLEIGKIGADNPVSACSGGNTYEYVGVDSVVTAIIDVYCTHTQGNFFYSSNHAISPLGIKFQLFFDLMNNCEPPEDNLVHGAMC